MEELQNNVANINIAKQYRRIFNRKGYVAASVADILLMGISFMATIYIACNLNKMPYYYNLLWLLPLMFGICMFISHKIIKEAWQNFPVLLIGALFFIRMVCSPFLFAYAGVREGITLNVEENTWKAILLICYECIAVFVALNICCRKYWKRRCLCFYTDSQHIKEIASNKITRKFTKGDKRMLGFLILCVGILVVFYVINPHFMDVYRTILDVTDANFATIEYTLVVAQYTTTVIDKFIIVTANYMLLVLRILIPAVVIYWSRKLRHKYIGLVIALCAAISPLFMIDGAIARSIYTLIMLFYELIYLYSPKNQKIKVLFVFFVGACVIMVYWIIRYVVNAENASLQGFFYSFSGTVDVYFSGLNVVSGAFNLPNSLDFRWESFVADVFGAIPYSGTLLGISENTLFNDINMVYGYIPSTIGMSYYYFGWLLSPLASIIFALIAFSSGQKYDLSKRPLKKVCYLFLGFYSALGIIMYSIEITLGAYIQTMLIMFIIERLCYGKERSLV